jgi:hypothetical protein
MKIEDHLHAAVKHAEHVKREHVRSVKGKPGRTDILTITESWRGTEPVCAVFTPPDRDRMLAVARVSAAGFGADTLAVTMETYESVSATMLNPDTGQRWGPGEMATYYEKHGRDNGAVSEALFVCCYNRAGDEVVQSLPYRIVGRVVEWAERKDFDTGVGSGIVPDTLRAIMADKTVHQQLGGAFSELSPEQMLAHGDAGTIQALMASGYDLGMAVFAEPGSVRAQVLRESLDRSQIVDPRNWNR